MKKILFFVLLIPTLLFSQSYDWLISAPQINQEAWGDFMGPTSLSDDGSVIAIGALGNDGNGTDAGHVRVFENISGVWTQIGSDIDGEAAGDISGGYSVSLSSDGSIVAIGAVGNDDNGNMSGHARIFENISGTWTQIGSDIDGEAAYDQFGISVSLSSDGSIVAIGAHVNDDGAYQAGHVRVFENVSGTWTQIGSDIDGQNYAEEFGYKLSLSDDGSVLAVGAYENDENGTNSGEVRIYENISGTWTQIGSDISGEGSGDQFGLSVSLSANGNIVALGGPSNDGNGSNSGHVRVFENISGVWTQIGSNIQGNSSGDYFGHSVSLSNDGLTLTASATNNGGYIRVLEYDLANTSWNQKGSVIVGNEFFLTSISGDASTIAASSQTGYRFVQSYNYGIINKTYIPDDTFEDYLESNGMGDGVANNDSVLTSNIQYVTDLTIEAGYTNNSNGIADFTGLDGFSSLDELNLSSHQLATSLDLSGVTSLTKLTINSFNYLFTLNTSGLTNLDTVNINYSSNITTWDLSTNTGLIYCKIIDTKVSSYDFSNAVSLKYLEIKDHSQLTFLDLDGLNSLEEINIESNFSLSNLSLMGNTSLISLNCSQNGLTNLDISGCPSLKVLRCNSNNNGSSNGISTITGIQYYTLLEEIYCFSNNLSSLELWSHPLLTKIYVYNNSLIELDLRNIPVANVTRMHAYGNSALSCISVDDSTLATSLSSNPYGLSLGAESSLYTWQVASNTIFSSNCNLLPKTYVPDDQFEAYLESSGWGDGISNNNYVWTHSINTITNLDVVNLYISDLTGIEDFSSLTNLQCQNNLLTSLDLSSNTLLTYLDCNNNSLSSLNVTNNTQLTIIECSYNKPTLTSLDFSNNVLLQEITCTDNDLVTLDISNCTQLNKLLCQENSLVTLDLSSNLLLDHLVCYQNQSLTTLNLSQNSALTYAEIEYTGISVLDLSSSTNLANLSLRNNSSLSSLDMRNVILSPSHYNQISLAIHDNINLSCIDVSDPALADSLLSNNYGNSWSFSSNSPNNWNNYMVFSTDCSTEYGCTDPAACNYLSTATIDNGQCILTNCVENITQDTYHSSIQAGIDASVNGDTLIAEVGTYVENINLNGKNIVLASDFLLTGDTSYISSTIIDGGSSGPTVLLENNEENCHLIGFTITQGYCGIKIENNVNSSNIGPFFTNLHFKNNGSAYEGSSIYVPCNHNISFVVDKCEFYNNNASQNVIFTCNINNTNNTRFPYIKNSKFYNNTINGGCVVQFSGENSKIENCIFNDNTSFATVKFYNGQINHSLLNSTLANNSGYAVYIEYPHQSSFVNIENSIIWGNNSNSYQFYVNRGPYSPANLNIDYSLVQLGANSIEITGTGVNWVSNYGSNNLDVDPDFNSDYSLSNFSLAIGAGNLSSALATDILGNIRPNPVGSNPDIGAYENALGLPLVLGCIDSLAYNFNSSADTSDGSCLYCNLTDSSFVVDESIIGASDGKINLTIFGTDCSNTPTEDVESYESDFGLWFQDSNDNSDWTRQTGGTSSNGTGPQNGLAYDGQYYIYTEASGSNYPAKVFNLYRDIDLSTWSNPVFSFWYHMYADPNSYSTGDMGSLVVEVSTDNGSNWNALWSKSDNQGDQWHEAVIDLSSYSGTIRIQLNATTGNSFGSDICVDYAQFKQNPSFPQFDPSLFQYIWSTGDTTRNVSNLTAGTYTVEYTDCNGCVGFDTATVVVNPVSGCMEPSSSNYNPSANISIGPIVSIINSADLLSDTIITCDSITIHTDSAFVTSLSWTTSNPSSLVSQLLLDGLSPFDIYNKGYSVDSLYGKTYEGGIIIHLDTINGSGIVAAPNDEGTAEWGCLFTSIGGTSTSIGSGENNTNLIVSGCTTSGIAADLCANSTQGGYTDWYLPSIDELVLFFNVPNPNFGQNSFTSNPFYNFNGLKYWSSSEDNFLNAWEFDFFTSASNGSSIPPSIQTKNTSNNVRAVRNFTYTPNYSAFVNTSGWNYLLATDSTGCTYDSIYVQVNVGGCIDPVATNFDSTASCDDGSCTLCYATIDFGTDTLNACDTAVITTAAITNATYSWSRFLDDPFPFGTVQQLLDAGYTPKEIYDNGYPLSLIYGSTYQGGTIFYLNTITGSGMLTTLNEIWVVDPIYNMGLSQFQWGCIGTQIGTSDSIGSGKRNTQLILDNCLDRPIAASVANEFQTFGYNDWFLPSKDEMIAIYNNTSYSSSSYSVWTSSEDANDPANRASRFYNGIWDEDKNNNNIKVLAVREFGASNTYTTNMPGTYFLTVTDSLGCTTTDSVHVDIYRSGCTDTAATNFDPLADGICNTGCTYCYATADFGTDTIQACDSIIISVPSSITSTYSWVTSNTISSGHSIQFMLDKGMTPLQLFNSGITLDSLYGKYFQGGPIFYLDTVNGTGLVASGQDLGYCGPNCAGSISFAPGPAHGYGGFAGTSDTIGSGMLNTINIINSYDSLSWCCSSAAQESYNLNYNGYSDWFLPSKDALALMYYNLHENGYGNFGTHYYWSSSEHPTDDALAWFHNFIPYNLNPTVGDYRTKNSNHVARSCRMFTNQSSNENSALVYSSGWNYVTVTDSLACTATDSVYVNVSIGGCTDTTAFNYDSLAECDNGTCVPVILGCMDSIAQNYSASANTDDGSCIYVGCMDSLACNFNPLASIDDGSCILGNCVNNISQNTFYTTIQSAINSSNVGDTNIVYNGTYSENVDFLGKNIVVASRFFIDGDTSHITNTIIDGGSSGPSVHFSNNEDSCHLVGFKIINGWCGVSFSNLNPSDIGPYLTNLIFTNNGTQYQGTAIYSGGCSHNSSFVVDQCEFFNNSGQYIISACNQNNTDSSRFVRIKNSRFYNNTPSGGVVHIVGENSEITNCLIADNTGHAAIVYYNGSYGHDLINTTISNNQSLALSIQNNSQTVNVNVENSIFSGNNHYQLNPHQVQLKANSFPNIINMDYSIITGGVSVILNVNSSLMNQINYGSNNLDVDPDLNSDYSLSNFSLAIGAGNILTAISTDILGNPRPNPSGSNPDIGAFEHVLATYDILGCMDPLATNYNSIANINDSSLCTYCYATADFGTDSIQACDSTLISINPSITSNYVWDTPSGSITNGQSQSAGNTGSNTNSNNLVLTGIMDFTVPSGSINGKAIHLTVNDDISDLSLYGIGVANNGQGTDGQEYTFDPISVLAGEEILLARSLSDIITYFDSCSVLFDHVLTATNSISQNGDDAIELFFNGNVIETFGDVNVDATGECWEYLDSWAYKSVGNGDPNCLDGNWIFGGVNCTDGTNTIWDSSCPYPLCYSTPSPSTNSTSNPNELMVDTSSWYYITVTDSLGCTASDSVYVQIDNSTYATDVQVACDSFTWINGVTYIASINNIIDTITNSQGCDSVVTLDLTIFYSNSSLETTTACDSYLWNGVIYTTTGVYDTVFTNVDGCDSTATLDLTVNYSNSGSATVTSCDNYFWEGITYDSSGVYTTILTNVDGCDSTATLNLTINYTTASSETTTQCDSYLWNGVTYDSSGTYTWIGTNSLGCDSVVNLYLTMNYSNSSLETTTACDSYLWNGVIYTTTGVYDTVFTNVDGCDSTATLDLTVNYSNLGSATVTSCDNYFWEGITYDSSGVYTTILTNVDGCDSTATLNLTINYTTASSETTTQCDSYLWNGVTYTTSGTYTWVGTNSVGCDSVVNLYLTMNYSNSSLETTVACDSYLWNGVTYTTTGVYDTVFTNVDGCDSTATLDLIVNYSNSSLETTTACDTYLWNGVTYDSTGSYSALFTNVDGCDSTAYLDLTINYSTTSSETTTRCNFYQWNGNVYTSSGIYTWTGINSVGCDSVVTLNLTINYSDGDTTTIVACDSYTWEGTTYTTSGLWNTILTNQYGCDSTAYIDLTVYYSNSGAASVTSCDSYLWEGVLYDSSGVYTTVLTNVDGCDSTATLDLTINYSSSSTTSFVICDGESVTTGPSVYTTPGTYVDILTTTLGCDSVVTTIVDVSYLAISTTTTPVTCSTFNDGTASVSISNPLGSYSYLWNTGATTSSIDSLVMGTYSVTVTDSACSLLAIDDVLLNVAPADSMHPEICYASVDYTGFNRVVLKPLENPLTANYIILREYSAGLYAPLDTLDASVTEYVDSTSNPSVQAERYKVTAIDACGNVTDTSAYHKTVHLTMNSGINGEVNLSWNQYEGYQVSNYLIFRGDSSGIMLIINSISGTNTSYTDLNPPSGSLTYQVRALAPICNPIPNALPPNDTLESNIIDYNNTPLSVSITHSDPSCYTCTDGFAIANAVGGSSPYTYTWSNGTSGNFNGGLGVGTYTVFVYDNMGDLATASVTLSAPSPGCTDPNALNYDPLATVDDGSCMYVSCPIPRPTGLYSFDVIDTRAKIGWDNMNDSACMVWKYFVRYREVGTSQWTTKSAGVGNGLCNFGLNTVTKQLLNLTPSTTYEFRMKAFYCGGTSSNYSAPVQFTTADVCPDMTNLRTTTFNGNQSKVRFNWDTTGAYTFARILLRVDTAGSAWQTAGGFGVYYPTLSVNKFGLTPGQSYRAQGRTFCDSNITAYRSPTWTSPIFWTQPGNIRLNGATAISDLEVYPNPSDDVFNISFSSDKIQDLKIRVLTVVGANVYIEEKEKFIGEYTKQVSLDKYRKGIYFLEIETNGGIINKKLILQ